jgi:hypothetical protein
MGVIVEKRLLELLQAVSGPGSDDPGMPLAESMCSKVQSALTRLLAFDPASLPQEVMVFIEQNYHVLESGKDMLRAGAGQFGRYEHCSERFLLQFLLLITSLGARGSWSVSVGSEARVYFDCNPMSIIGTVRCQSDGARASIAVNDGAPTRFESRHGHWLRTDDGHLFDYPKGDFKAVLFHQGSPFEDEKFLTDLRLAQCDAGQLSERLVEALDLIAQYYPDCLIWLNSGLRGIVFTEPRGTTSLSGSAASNLGMIFVSFPMDADLLAVSIVHEVAHQYFRLPSTHTVLVREIGETAYSPFKLTQRPMDKIFLALHAGVNIRHLTSRMREGGFSSDYIDSEDDKLRSDVAMMADSMNACASIMPAGRELLKLMGCGAP